MSRSIANCALCRESRPLQRSHLLPQAVYKYIRNNKESNPHPIMLSAGVEHSSSRQARKYLLCRDCEIRFQQNGENWVLRRLFKPDEGFELLDILDRGEPLRVGKLGMIYAIKALPEIDASQLGYFALSVFWRAAVTNWTVVGRLQELDFGRAYLEGIRHYLLRDTDRVENSALRIMVCDKPSLMATSLLFPVGGRDSACHWYSFMIPGIRFDLFLGKRIPAVLTSACVISGQTPCLVRCNYEKFIIDTAWEHLRKNAKKAPA